jgi:hypothetical protein
MIPLMELPADFARFEPGQWFEAMVERDRSTRGFRKMRYVKKVHPLSPMTSQELEAFWETLPTTASRPESPRDPTKP